MNFTRFEFKLCCKSELQDRVENDSKINKEIIIKDAINQFQNNFPIKTFQTKYIW